MHSYSFYSYIYKNVTNSTQTKNQKRVKAPYFPMKSLVTIICILLLTAFTDGPSFITNQKKYERVRTAYKEKENVVKTKLRNVQLEPDNFSLLFIAYKHEKKLEVYAKSKTASRYVFVCSYDICASSGVLGPKRMQGDNQVPEGFYYIDRFNPNSSYYLSLGINYPNASDKKKSQAKNPGGDIFIHGECVTIGCMPMTNDKIKELYLLAIQAYQNGQKKIPVYVFPFQLTNEQFQTYQSSYASQPELISFWKNLKMGYDLFHQQSKELVFTVDANGDYIF